MNNPGIHHIAIFAHDLKKLTHFYETVLGFERHSEQKDEKGLTRAVWFEMGGVILMLEKSGNIASMDPHVGATHASPLLAFTMKPTERDQLKNRIQKAGISITKETDYTFYFEDPEGNRLAFSHYPIPM